MHSRLDSFIDAAYATGTVRDAEGGEMQLVPTSIERAAGEALRDLAVSEGASQTVEVGLALGMSALFLCQGVLAVDPDGGRHVAIDPCQRTDWRGAGLASLAEAGVAGMVEVIEEGSELALPQLVREGRRFDFAFVDGNHRFEAVLLDLVFMDRLVKPGGVIVADDMWMPSVRMAVAYVERNLDLELEPNAIPNAFSWRRGLKRGELKGTGEVAVLRVPTDPPARPWDRFDPFV
ncbi:MAG TPA: class I SAM-dependent methyltransferase [Thermoleophilaceae bacterium]|nr:class I SAM-dependent methyltransferase [Thermoleophilaceae bacterium]